MRLGLLGGPSGFLLVCPFLLCTVFGGRRAVRAEGWKWRGSKGGGGGGVVELCIAVEMSRYEGRISSIVCV